MNIEKYYMKGTNQLFNISMPCSNRVQNTKIQIQNKLISDCLITKCIILLFF